ncbi:glycosyltransferase family 9 protein [Candidatus Nitrospira inopinata]|uniref:Putative lipopolysaccharide heptosyltransferase III n=1 Tax=Candidatus Nitrospira inopinata TaxID=1715989 RepID=A0A0S4L001_9BACT|nr:glycosyltransferase family 9 protein [Candidatus Nitrospira inopinata]CUQ68059.1 putative lipopolysaccharide heptosyltransferase III [Candidatus Nitrospira inopinata]
MIGPVAHVLVICTRRIGDVLLATPVVRSLKTAYPTAAIDMLVFEGTEDVISANPDIDRVWTVAERPTTAAHARLLRSLWRRYDLALSVLAGDRPTFYAWVAGRRRVGLLRPGKKAWWKRRLLNQWVPFDRLDTHTVAMNLRLLEPVGIKPLANPVVEWKGDDEEAVQRLFPSVLGHRPFAVLHVSPKFSYKMWTAEGWAGLGRWLTDQGLPVIVTGGDTQEELAYCEDVTRRLPGGSVNLAGQLGLPALGYLLSRAAVYVGTDTAVSHMAAAVGAPTVVLFGPSNPVKWGPWPKDFPFCENSPWKTKGTQRQGNVLLLQGEGDCVPCYAEGCDRHIDSRSDCLQNLSVDRVIHAVETMLTLGRPDEPCDRSMSRMSVLSTMQRRA